METRFAHDFSGVRVHAGATAATSAGAVQARAFTLGQDIVFGAGQYAPNTESGLRLLAHELTHTLQQRNAANRFPHRSLEDKPDVGRYEAEAERHAKNITAGTFDPGAFLQAGPAMGIQLDNDRQALRARLREVRARLARLRRQQAQLSEEFTGSVYQERQRESLERGRRQLRARARSETAARTLWGGRFSAATIRRAVTTSQSGNTVTLAANLQITYLALSDAAARQRAAGDIARIEAAIRDVWQVNIRSGEYAGIAFRLQPTVTLLPRGQSRADNAFLIQVRGPDSGPSAGDPVQGTISLARNHLDGSRVIVVAHELAHLFGFTDAYLTMTRRGPEGETIERWAVARPDPANRPDLLGMIDPVVLARLQREGAVTRQQVARQTGTIRIWEEEASRVLATLGVTPPPRRRPTPGSEGFDPAVELDRIRREGEARLAPIRERRRRTENSLQWLTLVQEIMRLEREERSLVSRLRSRPSP
jgi:hypothetical protein